MLRYFKDPFTKDEVSKIIEHMIPSCDAIKEFASSENDSKNNIIEVPYWKDKLNDNSFWELYKQEPPLDVNNSKNLFKFNSRKCGIENHIYELRKILEQKYQTESIKLRYNEEEYRVLQKGSFYYPNTGYMGWHTNCGSPGERFYISWASEERKSFFRYYDYEKNKIITDYDNKGLTVRQFTVPNSAPHFWHCVGSECDRFSFGFKVKNKIILDYESANTFS